MAGDCDKAREVWARCSELAGPSAPLLHMWAIHELRAGGPAARRRAKELLSAALAADPYHGPSLQASAALEDRSGASEQADAMYEAGLAELGAKAPSPLGRSGQSEEGPLPDEPGATAEGLGEAEPQEVPAATVLLLHSRAQQLLRRGDREGAEAVLLRLEALDPLNPHLCHTRGVLATQQGDLSEAMRWFNRGLARKGARGGALSGGRSRACSHWRGREGSAAGGRAVNAWHLAAPTVP
jgi:hypothetical protein